MLRALNITDGYRVRSSGILVPTYEKFATRAMREHFGLKKYQRGILQVAGATQLVQAGGPVTPLATDIEIVFSVSSGLVNAAVVFNEPTVGALNNIVARHNALHFVLGDDDQTVPVDHTGEWTTDSPIASEWEIACTGLVSGSWDFEFAAVTVFSDFTNSDMEWRENRPGGKSYVAGTDSCTADFEIREIADTGNNTTFEVICTGIQT